MPRSHIVRQRVQFTRTANGFARREPFRVRRAQFITPPPPPPPPAEPDKLLVPTIIDQGEVKTNIERDEVGNYLFSCPNCGGMTTVAPNQLNCQIFRHATHIETGIPINPHMPKAQCDALREAGKIRGCARPFKFDGQSITLCGYV